MTTRQCPSITFANSISAPFHHYAVLACFLAMIFTLSHHHFGLISRCYDGGKTARLSARCDWLSDASAVVTLPDADTVSSARQSYVKVNFKMDSVITLY